MANRDVGRTVGTIQHGVVCLPGSFAIDTPPTGLQGSSWFSVVRTAEGVYTVTLTDRFFLLSAGQPALQRTDAPGAAGANAAAFAVLGNVDLTARTIVIRLIDVAGTARDTVANANNRVNFTLFVRNSSVNS